MLITYGSKCCQIQNFSCLKQSKFKRWRSDKSVFELTAQRAGGPSGSNLFFRFCFGCALYLVLLIGEIEKTKRRLAVCEK